MPELRLSEPPSLGDYNNDGIGDIGIFVRSTRVTSDSDSNYFQRWNSPAPPGLTDPDRTVRFNVDFPIPGDYDGDGITDFAGGIIENGRIVWRIKRSSDGGTCNIVFGLPNDKPVSARLRLGRKNRYRDRQARKFGNFVVHITELERSVACQAVRTTDRYTDHFAECVLAFYMLKLIYQFAFIRPK